jgi:phage shock protein A
VPHDKIKAAARKRKTETGEPYAPARRAVVAEHQGSGQIPAPGAGYALRMSSEIHDWLTDLRGSNPRAAIRVTQALTALMEKGAGLGDPLVISPADSWPWALTQAIDRSYQENLEQLALLHRGEADAATLVKDAQDQAAELESAQAKLADLHRQAIDAGRPQEAARAASNLAAAQQQAAEVRRLLPTVIEARNRLGEAAQRLHARVDAFRVRKETLKAGYVAARSRLEVHQTIAASGLEETSEAISAAEAALADATAQMERELGQEGWPQGLMELRPGAPVRGDISILFAVEPPATALLIAVLEGLDAVEDQFPEAVMASADMLRRVRAGQAPEAAVHGYESTRSFLDEFYPGNVADGQQ